MLFCLFRLRKNLTTGVCCSKNFIICSKFHKDLAHLNICEILHFEENWKIRIKSSILFFETKQPFNVSQAFFSIEIVRMVLNQVEEVLPVYSDNKQGLSGKVRFLLSSDLEPPFPVNYRISLELILSQERWETLIFKSIYPWFKAYENQILHTVFNPS